MKTQVKPDPRDSIVRSLCGLTRLLRGLRHQEHPARVGARTDIQAALPTRIRQMRHQWLGTISAGCAATWGVHEACDFSCTACYLSSSANRSEPLSFDAVREQLDEIFRHKGPGANTQITAGEVTLLPREALARIVRYARSLPLDPMVMTHGQTFDRDPSYLHHLMREGGLQKVAIHVDLTQRGRDGYKQPTSETELVPVRERMADIVRNARAETGLPLHASHTVTVTPDNLEQVPDIIRFMVDNADAFRMVSLQPVASVGRTRTPERVDNALDAVWRGVGEGLGRPINPRTFLMGHPDCHAQALLWVVQMGGRREVIEVARKDKPVDAAFIDTLRETLPGLYIDDATTSEAVGRVLGRFRRNPRAAFDWVGYALYRIVGDLRPVVLRFVRAASRGESVSIRPLVIISHRFMSPEELDTPLGRERLSSCTFTLPVGGEMIPMCQMNATDTRATLIDALVPAARLTRR